MNIQSKYGKFEIVQEVDPLTLPCGQTNRAFIVQCDCGEQKIARLANIVREKIKCVLCSNPHNIDPRKPLYKNIIKLWRGIKTRTSKKGIDKHVYFDRGIKVCDLWVNDFIQFYQWCIENGYSPDLTIDRIDNEKGYSPDNCRFVTAKENALNKRDTFYYIDGDHKEPLLALLRRKGIEDHYHRILNKIKRGCPHKKAVETPIRKGKYFRGPRK